jgi:hypothetical protein
MNRRVASGEQLADNDLGKPLLTSRLRNIGAPAVMVVVAAVIAAFPEGTSRPGANNPRVAALVSLINRQKDVSNRLYGESCTLRRSAPNVSQAEIDGLRQDKLDPAAVLKAHRRISDPQTTQALSMAAKMEELPIHGGPRPPIPGREFAEDYDFELQMSYRHAIARHGAAATNAYAELKVLTEGSGTPQLSIDERFNTGLPITDFRFHPKADFQQMNRDIEAAALCQENYQDMYRLLSK